LPPHFSANLKVDKDYDRDKPLELSPEPNTKFLSLSVTKI